MAGEDVTSAVADVNIERVPVGRYRYRYIVKVDGQPVGEPQTSLRDAQELAREHGAGGSVAPAAGPPAGARRARPRVHGTVRGRVGRREVTVEFSTVGVTPSGVQAASVKWDAGECDPTCARTFGHLVAAAAAFASESGDALHLAAEQGFAVSLNAS